MSEVQLTGSLSLDSTDFSDQISKMVIKRTRNSATRPARLGNIRETDAAGVLKESLEITFVSDLAASSVWATLWDALDTDTAELTFSGNLEAGATSDSNPGFEGTIVVNGVDTGGTVGETREQNQTYSITDAGVTKTVA